MGEIKIANCNEDGIYWEAHRYNYRGLSVALEMYGNRWYFSTEGSLCTESFELLHEAKIAAEEAIDYELEQDSNNEIGV